MMRLVSKEENGDSRKLDRKDLSVRMYNMEELYEICTSLGKSLGIEFALIDASGKAMFRLALRKDVTILKYRGDYKIEMINALQGMKEEGVLLFTDNLGLQYLAVSIPTGNEACYLVGGPFLTQYTHQETQNRIVKENQIPLQDQHFLFEAFKTMKSLNQEEYFSMGKLMLWIIRRKHLSMELIYRRSRPYSFHKERPMEIEESFTLIDERYRIQNELMHHVSLGDAESARKVSKKVVFDFTYRVPGDPLRAIKNQYLTLNTMLRLGIEKEGVTPLALHQLSDNMAILIEGAQSVDELLDMGDRLILEYSTLVNRHKTRGLSRNIHHATRYIENHLDEKMQLKEIAASAKVSPSHLSRQFKKETGQTLTAFIQTRRMEKAKTLLSNNKLSITEVAIQCGFDQLNYFSKVFRQYENCTPLEYQKQHK